MTGESSTPLPYHPLLYRGATPSSYNNEHFDGNNVESSGRHYNNPYSSNAIIYRYFFDKFFKNSFNKLLLN